MSGFNFVTQPVLTQEETVKFKLENNTTHSRLCWHHSDRNVFKTTNIKEIKSSSKSKFTALQFFKRGPFKVAQWSMPSFFIVTHNVVQ